MAGQWEYLRENHPDFVASFNKAKELAQTDVKYFIIEIGLLAEQTASRACAHMGVVGDTHFDRLKALEHHGLLPENYARSFHEIRSIRNDVMHANASLHNVDVQYFQSASVNTLRWFDWIMPQNITVPPPEPYFPKIWEFLVWDTFSNLKIGIVILIVAMLLWRWLTMLFGQTAGSILLLAALIPVWLWREKQRMWFYKGWLQRHGKKAALIIAAIVAAFAIDRMITSGVFVPVAVLAAVAFVAFRNRKKS